MTDAIHEACIEAAREGSLYLRLLDDRGLGAIAVYPLLYGNVQVALVSVPLGAIVDVYYYSSPRKAIEAAKGWSGAGEPMTGWHRHPPSGRRREGGDPAKETVRP